MSSENNTLINDDVFKHEKLFERSKILYGLNKLLCAYAEILFNDYTHNECKLLAFSSFNNQLNFFSSFGLE